MGEHHNSRLYHSYFNDRSVQKTSSKPRPISRVSRYNPRSSKKYPVLPRLTPCNQTSKMTVEIKQTDKSIFPDWLRERKDFQEMLFHYDHLESVNLTSLFFTPENQRDPIEQDIAVRWLKLVPFFKNMSSRLLIGILKTVNPQSISPHTIIMEEDSEGDNMYILLKGSVGIYIQNQKIAVIGPRNIIGEKSFLTGNKRSATAKTIDQVYVLEIRFSEYETALNNEKLREIEGIVVFLKTVPYFDNWSLVRLKQFASQFYILHYECNQIIYTFNDAPVNMFILKDGLILRQVKKEISFSYCWPKTAKSWEKVTTKKVVLRPIRQIKPKGFFGVRELLNDELRQTQITTIESSVVYMIPANAVFKYLDENEKRTLNQFETSMDNTDNGQKFKKEIMKIHRNVSQNDNFNNKSRGTEEKVSTILYNIGKS